MRILTLIILTILGFSGFSQSVIAPDPKSFARSTAGQDASGFSLTGFSPTSTLLCAIGLPQAPAGTTFYLTTTTGLTPASGYTMTGNKSRLAFTGTMANINNALATLKINTTATNGNIQISVSATVNPVGYFYNPTNGHFYRPISSGANFANAILLSSQQTFKGQTGYLVTITSSDEDNFIFNNVPQSNIWFAADDRLTEGRWVISAGPEVNTLLRVGNAGGTNQQGVYNNWASGEPNDWGGNEDAAVTKWGGGNQWNDLSTANVNPYVVEFGTWTNPDDATFTEFYSSSVIHSNGDVFRIQYNFNFSNLSSNRFSVRTQSRINNSWVPYTQNYFQLNNIGRLDATNLSDTVRSQDGSRATVTPGSVEWSYVNISGGTTTLFIDLRTFNGIDPSSVKNVSVLDVYNGPVTYQQTSLYWAHYIVPSSLPSVTNGTSSFNSSIRNSGNGNYAFSCSVSFSNNNVYKQQGVQFQSLISDTITAMLDRIVTVSDVYLAFREYSDGGIFGNSSNHFTSGIQFMNADVDNNGQFNETDCFILLKHLLGQESLLSQNNLQSFLKLLPKSEYDAVNKSNWQNFLNSTSDSYNGISFSNTSLLNSFTINAFWKGDVNMSHSPAQTASTQTNSIFQTNITQSAVSTSRNSSDPSSYVISYLSGDSLNVIIKFNPNSNEIVGTQFRVNYDNTILKHSGTQFKTSGSPTNFSNNRGNYINVGSIIMGGGLLGSNTEYKISFKVNKKITNSLGLVSIASNEAVDRGGSTLKIRIE